MIDLDDYNWLQQAIFVTEKPQADALAPILADYFKPKSVIDLGCGPGIYIWPLRDDHGIEVHGVDGCPNAADYGPVEIFDLREPYRPTKQYDLCICLEVLEHIEAEFAQVIVDSIARCAPAILVTAAPPGQGGHHHVNEQPQDYWIVRFAQAGMEYDESATHELRGIFAQGEPFRNHGWMINNSMVFRRAYKLDLGSGQFPREGYLGLDIVFIPGVDCVCNICYLPIAGGTIAEIYISHTLEHLTRNEGTAAIAEIWRTLTPGGRVEIHVPDLEGHIEQYFTGDREWAMAGFYGWQLYVNDVHKWGYSYDSLCELLRLAGFVRIQRFNNHPQKDNPIWLAVEAYKER